MEEKLFKDYLGGRKLQDKEIQESLVFLKDCETFMVQHNTDLKSMDLADINAYNQHLIDNKENSFECLRAIARYCYITKKDEIYTYYATILQTDEVTKNIKERIHSFGGEEKAKQVYSEVSFPPLGTSLEGWSKATKTFMKSMEKTFGHEECRKIMTGNMHSMPESLFIQDRELFKKVKNLDEFLIQLHQASVEELDKHYRENKIWYEQKITKRVVDFVKENPEVMGGVRKGNKLYLTKIPYNPDAYVQEKDPVMKRYYACHCPFVREAVKNNDLSISPDWCYCSGGYTKLQFDVIFEEPVEIEVLETPLKGDSCCRFVITIPEKIMKSYVSIRE